MKVRAIFLSVLILLAGALFISRSKSSAAPDFPTNNSLTTSSEIVIDIPSGSSGSAIAQILYENGVVKSAQAFFRAAVGDKRSEKIAPGNHRLTLKISAKQALDQLLDANRIPNLIKIFEGGWKSEVITSLIKYGFKQADISKAFSSLSLPKGFKDSEGLLFPAQYSFAKATTAQQAIQSMIDRFTNDSVGQQILIGANGFNALQLLTMASIIQAEGDEKDFPKISRVIRNRLAKDMPLQLDSTVHFIKKVRGQIFLSTQSTLLNSPYNTYKRYGLPPGPIGSPGIAAMKAALQPAVGNWLFFITVAPGDTRFTNSYQEFTSWKALYAKNRKAGAFK
jgi:UPF0755 protein